MSLQRWQGPARIAVGGTVVVGLLASGWQSPPLSYRADHLACATFLESVRSEVRSSRGGTVSGESGGRTGRLRIRATGAAAGIRVEVWYDSLDVWRDTPTLRLSPDTDGLVGGRWRGWLSPEGRVDLETRPFMPPEILEVTDLSELPSDFFPPLAPASLQVGEEWTDSAGLRIERLPDSSAARHGLGRFRWHRTAITTSDDPVRITQHTDDQGLMVWAFDRGPVEWNRTVSVDSDVRRGLPDGDPLRGQVDQLIVVRRLPDRECD